MKIDERQPQNKRFGEMEQYHTVPVGAGEYIIIGIDKENRTVRWVAPKEGFLKTRQAAHRRRERLAKQKGTKDGQNSPAESTSRDGHSAPPSST